MEFDINDFAKMLKEWFTSSPLFPVYEPQTGNFLTEYQRSRQQSDSSKHPNRHPVHLNEVAKQCVNSTTITSDDMVVFDYGNYVMETNYQYYHILENSPVIRKRGKGTEKSKGSQAKVQDLGQRDYGRVSWNGKTFTKEYSRNVRGSRNRTSSVSHWAIVNGQGKYINRESNSYKNVHYRYIENILENDVIYKLCSEFNLKPLRKVDTGLVEEFAEQQDTSVENILEVFGSFME